MTNWGRIGQLHPLEACTVRVGSSLRDVLVALETGAQQIVMVVGEEGRLVGIFTDGDARRAILSGASLDACLDTYCRRNFFYVAPEAGRAEVLDLMTSKRINEIPIVSTDGQLIGLHTLQAIVGAFEKPNWAVVMAGGRGERLRPLTDTVPKPMIRVAGRPILERIVLHLISHGISTLFLSINYKAEQIESYFGDGSALGCRVHYLKEDRPLGTGGSLSLLPERPQHPLVVCNGDLLTEVDFSQMLAFHERGGFAITVGCHEYVHTVPLGVLELQGNRVTGVQEKPTACWNVNAGIYVLNPELLGRVPSETYFPLPGLLGECIQRGEVVGAYSIKRDWMDVGRHEELQRARGEEVGG